MITKAECDVLEAKTICSGCVGEAYLAGFVNKESKECECSYCGDKEASCIALEVF